MFANRLPRYLGRHNPNRPCGRAIVAGALSLFSVAALGFVGVRPAAATPQMLCGIHSVGVLESLSVVGTDVFLASGQGIQVTASGLALATSLPPTFSYPNGNTSVPTSSAFPLPSAPAYSLIARIGAGPWTYVGLGATIANNGAPTGELQLRLNDPTPNNGYGGFTANFTTCVSSDTAYMQYRVSELNAAHSGMCLDVAWASQQSGAGVVQANCVGTSNQSWTAVNHGGYYQIVAAHSGKCLDVAWASQQSGASVVQANCVGTSNQLWTFTPAGSGRYMLVARHSGMCLAVAGASLESAAPVVQTKCVGSANQAWSVQPTAQS